jgi:hypothetical protein
MLCKRGRVFPVKKYLKKFWNFKRAVIHIAENPRRKSGNGICRRALGRSIDYSTAIQAERGIGDIKPLLKYFIALYYRQGGSTYYMYTPITIARLDT